jgi:hypothetical protein
VEHARRQGVDVSFTRLEKALGFGMVVIGAAALAALVLGAWQTEEDG